MTLNVEQKKGIMDKFKKHEKDTGSSELQVALLTERINLLTEHFKANPKDHHSRRGLLMLVGQRKRLLGYIKKLDIKKYRDLISTLELRR